MLPPRSKLFIPGNRTDLMHKAAISAADALSFDLEDAVPEAEKDSARLQVSKFLGQVTTAHQVWVRINSRGSGLLIDDIAAIAGASIDVINLPKAESARDIHLVDDLLDHFERKSGNSTPTAIVPTIETARGLNHAVEIASASPRVAALQLGSGDLRESAGIVPSTEHLRAVRTLLSLAAAEVGIPAIDSAYTDIGNPAGFAEAAMDARALGFRGKSCIHPSQVADANRIFSPSDEELEEAREIVKEYDLAIAQGIGAIKVRGRLVDGPIVETARRLLELAR
jgi:citrate lyase subunit beta/citryl-CoA lyase